MSHTISELRTLKEKANAEVRVATDIAKSIEMLLNSSERVSERYRALKEAHTVATNLRDQALATLESYRQEARLLGAYKKKKAAPSVESNDNAVETTVAVETNGSMPN